MVAQILGLASKALGLGPEVLRSSLGGVPVGTQSPRKEPFGGASATLTRGTNLGLRHWP